MVCHLSQPLQIEALRVKALAYDSILNILLIDKRTVSIRIVLPGSKPIRGSALGLSYLVVSQREGQHWEQELEQEDEDGVDSSTALRHGLGAGLQLAQLVDDDLLQEKTSRGF